MSWLIRLNVEEVHGTATVTRSEGALLLGQLVSRRCFYKPWQDLLQSTIGKSQASLLAVLVCIDVLQKSVSRSYGQGETSRSCISLDAGRYPLSWQRDQGVCYLVRLKPPRRSLCFPFAFAAVVKARNQRCSDFHFRSPTPTARGGQSTPQTVSTEQQQSNRHSIQTPDHSPSIQSA
jgi:hypothetical protein